MASKLQHSIVLSRERQVEIERQPVPSPGPTELLCRTLRSLISTGTELGKIRGEFYWTTLPCVLGYSNVAVIEEAGSQVKDFRPGQRIYSQAPHTSFFTLEPATSRFVPCLLHEGISDEAATFTTHCAVAWYGIRKAGLTPGAKIMVIGDGLVGLLVAQLAMHGADARVFMAGLHDFRLAQAAAIGVVTVNASRDNLAAFANEATASQGFSLVINTAGVPASLLDAISVCSVQGRVIQLGTIAENVTLPIWEVERKEIEIVPAFQPLDPRAQQLLARKKMIELLSDGKLPVEKWITHRFEFRLALEAYDRLLQEKDRTLGVIFTYA